MIAYARDEMVGITELGKSLGKYLDKVLENPFNKLAIIRRNEPEAVIVPIKEYEYMRRQADMLEDMQIAQTIKERVLDRKEPIKMLSTKELKAKLIARGKNVL
jgi:PHD/YefM family antitoxin component YafN of YafNO toxin-antitoxin module